MQSWALIAQDSEHLSFLATALGSHMVLQREPQRPVVWGFTKPGAEVTTTMAPSSCVGGRRCAAQRSNFSTVADAKVTRPVVHVCLYDSWCDSRRLYDFWFDSRTRREHAAKELLFCCEAETVIWQF